MTIGSDLSVNEVLQKTAEVYATCTSYRDFGTVQEEGASLSRILLLESPLRFSTVFVRPDRFRFHYSKHSLISSQWVTVWMNGKRIEAWEGRKNAVANEYDGISTPLWAYKGTSSLSSYAIPKLLLSEHVSGGLMTNYLNPFACGYEVVEGRSCLRIVGSDPVSIPTNPFSAIGEPGESWTYEPERITTTIWIDTETYLIMKIGIHSERLNLRHTIRYRPELNPKISARELELNHGHD